VNRDVMLTINTMKSRVFMNCIKCFVLTIALLSSPAWSDDGGAISLNFTDAQTSKVLKIVADFSSRGLVLPDSKLGLTTVYLKDVPWKEALLAIATSQNLDVEITDKLIIISKKM
jgi:type II secretory pathway component HofQ